MKRHLAAIAILSLFAALGLELYKEPTYQFPVAMGSALGSALAFLGLSLGIPAIPAGIYWMAKRQPMPGFPQVAWMIWVLFVGSVSYGTYLKETSSRFSDSKSSITTYVPEACEYSVAFPGTPKITTFHVPGLGEFPRAEYIGDANEQGLFLRVECISFPKAQRDILDDKDYLLNQTATYAEVNGLTNAEFHYEDTEFGRLVTVRGFKTVAERPVTYEVRQYLGRHSLLSMYAGGASSHYPPSAVAEFFSSIGKAGSEVTS